MIRSTRRIAVAVVGMGVLASTATAQAQTPETGFSCRASALKAPLLGERFIANNQFKPCAPGHSALASGVGIGSGRPNQLTVRASALTATTSTNPVDPRTGETTPGGAATSSVAFAHINVFNLVKLDAYGLATTAGRKCLNGQPDIGGSAAIAYLRLNGRAIPVTAYNVNIPLIIGTLRINNVQRTSDELRVRALWLDLAGDANDIIIAESKASATGNPCQVVTPPPTTPGT